MNYLPRPTTAKAIDLGPLYGALASAQGAFPEINKNKTGHGYKYADMADILRAVRPILSENGLAVFQRIDGDKLTTTLAHRSGGTLTSSYPLVQDGTGRMNNIQRMGAAMTYARRYSLTALLGVAADEDVDADDVKIDGTGARGSEPANSSSAGLRDAWTDGIMDALPDGATDRERAVAFSDAIIKEMQAKKSKDGLNGVWAKREKIISALDLKQNDLYQNIFDAFHDYMEAFS